MVLVELGHCVLVIAEEPGVFKRLEDKIGGHVEDFVRAPEALFCEPESDYAVELEVDPDFGSALPFAAPPVNDDKSRPAKKGARFARITSHATGR